MANRRKSKRLKIDRHVRVPVQICPVMPFLGRNIDAHLLNISKGGMSLAIQDLPKNKKLKKGTKLKIHFHWPGSHLFASDAQVSHWIASPQHGILMGIKFHRPHGLLVKEINKMVEDEAICESRVQTEEGPWCDVLCSFHGLCRKAFRATDPSINQNQIEFSIQIDEDEQAA